MNHRDNLAGSALREYSPGRWTTRRALFALSLLCALFLSCVPVRAADGGRAGDAQEQIEAAAPQSPRASVEKFFLLCRAGRYAAAAAYLDLSDQNGADPALLARRLKAVLDRHWVDLSEVSGKSEGALDDGLSPNTEQIAEIPMPHGEKEPVRLHRDVPHGRWQFSASTVAHIDAWYAELGNRWLLDRLPEVLLRPGPRNVEWWQWLAFPLLLLVASMLGAATSRIVNRLLGSVARRTSVEWDDAVLSSLRGPITLGLTMTFTLGLAPFLELYQPAEKFLGQLVRAFLLGDFFWGLSRLIDVSAAIARKASYMERHPTSRTLVPLAVRVCKIIVLALAVIAFLSELGYPVASLIAGLGLGGLAFALAAQKTIENLFGAFTIGADQPFREGDFVKIDDFVGTVELIGLRSTKIRTLDRTLVSLPNGALAEKRLESFSARDRIRLACTLGLVYETTADQMRKIIGEVEALLRAHPKIWPDAVIVRFVAFADFSLNVDVMCWFLTADWNEFQLIRQEVLLDIMGVVERAGSGFAFPTRTVHVVNDMPSPAVGSAGGGDAASVPSP